tara:strand:+ start:3970 stop:4134 length:165 start_codon:yes stop_codon:yes gene_type:complete
MKVSTRLTVKTLYTTLTLPLNQKYKSLNRLKTSPKLSTGLDELSTDKIQGSLNA